jgi:conserved oligomeric Golgi complex subunit 3
MMKNYVTNVLKTATEQVLSPPAILSEKEQQEYRRSSSSSSDIAFALYYGKFQASAPRVKKISTTIEQRYEKSPDYEQLLSELHQFYLNERAIIMKNGVNRAVTDLTKKHKGDHCTLVRAACAFLVHVCQDEHRLFFQFFTIPSGQLT